MKVLYFTNNLFSKDGWSKYSLDLMTYFVKNKDEVICLVTKKNEDYNSIKQYNILKEPLKYLNNPLNIFVVIKKIRKIIKKENPEIIHFLVEPYMLFLPFIYNPRIKYILTIHGSYAIIPLKKLFTKFLTKWCYEKIDKIIAVSNYTKNRLLKLKSGLDKKIEIVYNGIDVSDASNIKKNNSIKKLVFMGEVKKRKGLKEAIESLRIYDHKYNQDFIFDIIGNFDVNDNYFQELKLKIKFYNLDKKINFLGPINNEAKIKYLKSADLYLMLSRVCGDYFEGFGLSYLEANKYGIPVIGPNDGGPKEAIKDGFSGFLVNIFNPKEVAEKVYYILCRDAIKQSHCLEWAMQNDINLRAKEIRAIYES